MICILVISMKPFIRLFSLGLLSFSLFACGSDSQDKTKSLNGLDELKTKVSELDQTCQADSDCSIVTDDFACRKSYRAIAKSALTEYQALAKKAEAFNKDIGCTMEYSNRYDPNNYTVFCSTTNSCSLEFREPESL